MTITCKQCNKEIKVDKETQKQTFISVKCPDCYTITNHNESLPAVLGRENVPV